MAANNGTIKFRVEKLERCYDKIDAKMDLVLTNHLPHINEELVKVRSEIKENRVKLGVIIGVFTGIFSLLVQLAFKFI